MRDTLLNAREAAAWLRLGANTLAKWRILGKGPRFTRAGRSIRYRRADLEAFVERRTARSTAEADHMGAM